MPSAEPEQTGTTKVAEKGNKMLEWLKTILGEAYSDEIDKKVSAEIGKGFVAKADFNAANETKKTLEGQLADRDKQLDALKNVDAAGLQAEITRLQGENKAAKDKFDADVASIKLNAAVDAAIVAAKGKNAKAVKALLNTESLKLKEDGSIEGLDLDAVKKTDPYLFDIESRQDTGTGDPDGGTDGGGSEEPPEDYAAYKKWREEK